MANEAYLPTSSEAMLSVPARRGHSLGYAWPIGLSLVLIGVMYASRKLDVTLLDVILSFLLILTACVLYRRWTENNATVEKWSAAPLLLTMALAYAQSFGAGIFWSSREVSNVDRGPYELSAASCSMALALAVVSLAAIYYGMQLRIADVLRLKTLPYLKEENFTWNYLRFMTALGIVTAHTLNSAGSMEGMRQIFLDFTMYAPLVAFCILFRRYLSGEGTRLDLFLMLAYAGNQIFAGVASGWLGSVVTFLLILITVYISVRKRLPITALAIVLAYVLFMQPGKERFRNEYWYGSHSGSAIERVGFWIQASAEAWGDVLSNRESSLKPADLLSSTTDRTSLVATTAQVVEYVPDVLPYQNGNTYGFLLVSWVPRALWPGKPSASDVNHLYQTSFRLTREENLNDVSIAPGIIGEAYWNFGWAGVVIMSLLLGIFLRFLEVQFARHSSGIFMNSLIVILIPQFLGIMAHMGTYIGGLPLQMGVLIAAFLPVLVFRHQHSGTASPTTA